MVGGQGPGIIACLTEKVSHTGTRRKNQAGAQNTGSHSERVALAR
jgi:hypothetical protein